MSGSLYHWLLGKVVKMLCGSVLTSKLLPGFAPFTLQPPKQVNMIPPCVQNESLPRTHDIAAHDIDEEELSPIKNGKHDREVRVGYKITNIATNY